MLLYKLCTLINNIIRYVEARLTFNYPHASLPPQYLAQKGNVLALIKEITMRSLSFHLKEVILSIHGS